MSRVGKKPISLPKGVEVRLDGAEIVVKGPKGQVTTPIVDGISMNVDNGTITLARKDEQRQSRWMDSNSARRIRVRCGKFGKGQRLTIECVALGGLDLDLVGTVTVSPYDPMSRWTCALTNRAGVEIVDVQFPFVVAKYRLGGKAGSETIVMPQSFGYLIREPALQKIGPDGVACSTRSTSDGPAIRSSPGGIRCVRTK